MTASPLSWWNGEFGPIAPLGHVLVRHLSRFHARFHSLPNSKRYADSSAEYSELVRRHIEIASRLFAPEELIFIYRTVTLDDEGNPLEAKSSVGGVELSPEEAVFWGNPNTVKPEDDDRFLARALVSHWKPHFFEELVRQVADELDYGIAFVSPETKGIYCPYDGGMDIFADPTLLLSLNNEFADWSPPQG